VTSGPPREVIAIPADFGSDDVNRLRVALGRTVRALDRRTNFEDLTRTQMTVLGSVVRRGRIGVAELAEFEAINPTMLSRIVGRLEERGLVQRVPDAVDRRVTHVEGTASGTKVWEEHRRERTRLLADLLADLPQLDTAALLAAVPALEALAERARPAEPPQN
jgi:DNA-binding MarR family transcriptional regulator